MRLEQFWKEFLLRHPELPQDLPLDAWKFGGSADTLVQLVLEGKKTATCSLLSVYGDGNVPMPVPGSYSVILDGAGNPKCVISLKETLVKKFKDVDEKHAWEEGESDRTLRYWREVHLRFFSRYEGFTEDSDLLCERFEVVS